MNKAKQRLIGSPSRDMFKQAHKLHAPPFCYASDLDLVFVSKKPNAHIVAFIDYKKYGEAITFAEVIAYNSLINNNGGLIYIVRGGDPQLGPFDIYQYCGGDWQPEPPIVDLIFLEHCQTWAELVLWEITLRRQG